MCGGRCNRAYEILRKMVPTTRHTVAPDICRVESYITCHFIYGAESDRPREGSHSCATDAAA